MVRVYKNASHDQQSQWHVNRQISSLRNMKAFHREFLNNIAVNHHGDIHRHAMNWVFKYARQYVIVDTVYYSKTQEIWMQHVYTQILVLVKM